MVTFSNGVESPAIFVGHDPETGFAVLKTQIEYLIPARLGDSNNIVPGAWNLMIGNSLGVYPSVVFGSINGIRNDGMIQISANLNPGNNGSPILNTKGEVVGLVAGQMNPRESLTNSFLDYDFHATILAYPMDRLNMSGGTSISSSNLGRQTSAPADSAREVVPETRIQPVGVEF